MCFQIANRSIETVYKLLKQLRGHMHVTFYHITSCYPLLPLIMVMFFVINEFLSACERFNAWRIVRTIVQAGSCQFLAVKALNRPCVSTGHL
jgi:hypothetical protein